VSGTTGGIASDPAGPWAAAAQQGALPEAPGMKLPFIDLIWRVRGDVPVDPALSPQEAFARLDPLLRTPGTTVTAEGDALTYTKRNPAAQDKLATFTRGRLWIERAGAGTVLRFDMFSHALLLAFLAPLLFLGFAQMAIAINTWEAAGAETSEKAKDEDKPKLVKKLNPVDEFLGAPAPEDPNKKKDEKKDEGRHSPDEGYFLAGLFAVIYLVGRWLEPWLVRRRFRAALASPPEVAVEA
jgi:hypothetical protein